jgi:putative membrane protein
MFRNRFSTVACAAVIALSAPAVVLAGSAESISPQDQHFVNQAWDINTTEIRLGNTVETKATESSVKSFGKRMIADHTKLNHSLAKLADDEHATLPKSLDKSDEDLIANLSKLSGSDFDKHYISAMIHGHTEAVAAFETEAKEDPHTAVSKWAAESLPTIKTHLALAEKTGKEIGVEAPISVPMVHSTAPKAQTNAAPAQSTKAAALSTSSAHHWWQFWNW